MPLNKKNETEIHYVFKHLIWTVFIVNIQTCLHKNTTNCNENKLILGERKL